MNKRTLRKIILWVGGGAIAACLLWWFATSYFAAQVDPRSKAFLSKVAAEINRSVPVMIDPETELMPAAGAEGILHYNYRVVGYAVAQVDRQKFTEGAKQRVRQAACSLPETRDGLLKKGVTLRYSYFDKDKQFIASFDVIPSDCGF